MVSVWLSVPGFPVLDLQFVLSFPSTKAGRDDLFYLNSRHEVQNSGLLSPEPASGAPLQSHICRCQTTAHSCETRDER